MSDFSLMCKAAIKDAGLSVYRISQISGLDRTTIQKMVSGAKFPGYSFFYRFLEYLRINEEQRRMLLRMFEIEKDSYASYLNRRKVLSIIGEIGRHNGETAREHDSFAAAAAEMSSGFLTKNEDELYVRLERALNDCRKQWYPVSLQMNIPVKMSKIYELLRRFFKMGGEETSLSNSLSCSIKIRLQVWIQT